jgi:hypothetical protein
MLADREGSALPSARMARSSFAPDPETLPRGVRWLPALRAGDAASFGEGAAWLARLTEAGIPIAPGWLASCADDAEAAPSAEALVAALRAALGWARGRGDAGRVVVGPWFATRAAQSRFGRDFPVLPDIADEDAVDGVAASLAQALSRSLGPGGARPGALRGVFARVSLRTADAAGAATGMAASADPEDGDPDMVAVWTDGARPWVVDRRTMRLAREGDAPLDDDRAARAADLVDRAQLALGRPVEVRWALADGRMSVVSARELALVPRFTGAAYRRVALMAEDEGTVAPLAVDAIDKALGRDDAAADEPRVRRVYARPYKRIDGPPGAATTLPGLPASPLARVGRDVARVAGDVASPLAAARRFTSELDARLARVDGVELGRLSDPGLISQLRERQQLVIDALVLLDRARVATLAALPAIEAAAGELPRDAYIALAAPRATRERRRAEERLDRLLAALQAAGLAPGAAETALPAALRRPWDEARLALVGVRTLGLDITPRAWGESDATLAATLAARAAGQLPADHEVREQARRAAVRRLGDTARGRTFGRGREAVVHTVALVLSGLADAKGEVAEALAQGLLRVRAAAVVAGERLCEVGILETPDDALYMDIDELEQSLEGEPGAYAARVRLRREDDQRWARYEAPRRLRARVAS